MAANMINVGVNVSDNGTVAQLQARLKAATKDLASLRNAMRQTSGGMAGMGGGPTKQENIDYRNARGVAGTGGGGSRDFAKQAQGLGGLVRLYATFAANIFAVSAAFTALDKAAQFEQMIQGAKALEGSTGAALRSIAGQMKSVTDGALSMQESMRLTALGSAAGLSQKKILELTKGAKGASLALGRDMADSIDRVIRGVAKLEPELLDELGVVTRAQEAYKNYAKNLNISTDALTSYQKTMAYSSAVAKELNDKFGDVNDQVEANPYAKFLGQLKDVGTTLLGLVNNVITPVIETITNNIELMFVGVLLLVKKLTLTALPEIAKLFTVSPAVLTARQAQNELMVASIKEANTAEINLAKAKNAELIAMEEARTIESVGINSAKLINTPTGVFSANSAITQTLDKGDALSGRQVGIVKRALSKTTSALETAEKPGSGASAKQLQILKERKAALNEILAVTAQNSKMEADSAVIIKKLRTEQKQIERDLTKEKEKQNTFSKAEKDLAKDNLAVLKLQKANAIENAKYYGTAAEAKRIGLEYDKKIEDASRKVSITRGLVRPQFNLDPSGKENPNFGINASAPEAPNIFGKISEGADSLKNKFKEVTSSIGEKVSKVVGFLGTWGVAAMIAFEAASFLADKFGLLNKKNEELNKSFDEATKVLETANSAYFKYTLAVTMGAASSTSLIQANTIVANTFDQVNDSIASTLSAFTAYENAQTGFSKFLDNILPGKSKFDQAKALVADQLAAAAAIATGFEKLQLETFSKRASSITEEDGIAALNKVREESETILARVSEAKKVESSRLQDLTKKYGDAANAAENFNKKQIIKNADLRIIDETLVELIKFMDSTATESAKLQMLASLPEEIAKLDKVLAASRQSAIEELASRRSAAEAQVKLLKQQKEQEDKYGLSRTELNLLEASTTQELIRLRSLNSVEQNRRENKYYEERIEKERKARKQMQETELAQKLRDDEIRDKTLKSLGYNVGKEMATGFFDWLLGPKLKAAAKELSPEAALAVKTAQNQAQKQLPNDQIAPNMSSRGGAPITKFGIDGTQNNAEKEKIKYEKESAEQARINSAARERSNMLDRLALDNELKLLKAQGEQLSVNNKIEERTSGYLSQQSIALEFANKREQESVQNKLNLLDIDTKELANQKKQGLEQSKTAKLLSDAKESVDLNYDTKLRTLNLEEKEKTIAAGMAKYNLESVTSMKQNLVVAQDALALKVLTGEISVEDALNQENILSLVNNTIERETILAQAKLDSITNEAQIVGSIYETKLKTNEAEAEHIKQMNKQKQIALERSQAQLKLDNLKAELDIKVGEATKTSGSATLAQMQEQFLVRQLQLQRDIIVAGGNVELVEQAKLKAQADFIALLEQELVVRKRNFASLSGINQAQTVYDEAVKRARDFQSNMKDTVTGVFDAVYSGMDAAIDAITTKMMNGTKITFTEISDLFRNTVAEGFREMAAEQLKSSARNVVKDTIGGIAGMFGVKINLDTNEEKALNYAERTAIATEALAGIGPTNALKGIAGMFGKDAPGMEGQGAFAALPLSVKLDSNSGFNMNSVQDNLDNAKSSAEYFATATDEAGNSLASLGEAVPGFFSGLTNSFGSLFGPQGIVMNLVSGLGTGIGGIFQSILGMFSGGGVGGGLGGIGGLLGSIGSSIGSGFETFSNFLQFGPMFANGGVMSEYGPLKLNKYASGGIANSPQMAIYGEGRMNEAYVPLPDGRTIPVTMQGNTGGGNGPISVVVNVDAKGNADAQTTGNTTAQDAKQLGLIISSKVREEIVNQQRSGGLLNKR